MMDVIFVHVKFCKFITKFKKILSLEEGNIENEVLLVSNRTHTFIRHNLCILV